MVNVDRIREDNEKRILRCSEGNRVWYQLWINPYLFGYIEMNYRRFIEEGVIKAWYMKDLYYVFFYEKKGGKVRGVFGKGNTLKLLGSIV